MLTRPITATAFSLRLRLHCKAARVGGVRRLDLAEVELHDVFFTKN